MSKIAELFSPTTRDQDDFKKLLPASFRDDHLLFHAPLDDISGFLQRDLSVRRLNDIQEFLWLAGRPMPPRPLSYQTSVSCEIIVDERVDMHLVWRKEPERYIHIKPLPPYLLDSRFWSEHLVCNGIAIKPCTCLGEVSGQNETILSNQANEATDCQRFNLRKSALGFLSSYVALIQHPSDFIIAQDHGLLPKSLEWTHWSSLVQNLLQDDISDPRRINRRYTYGELRLSRLNKIYFFIGGSLLRGYRAKDQTLPELLHAYLGPITAMTVYIALALTAMQVGLATEKLQNNKAFQDALYGVTVLTIIGPWVLVSLLILFTLFSFSRRGKHEGNLETCQNRYCL